MGQKRQPEAADYLPASGVLDWTDAKRHWAQRPRPCWHCKVPTCLRDGGGRPSHKTCAETYLARRQAHTARVYAERAHLDD